MSKDQMPDNQYKDKNLPVDVLRKFRLIFGSVKSHFKNVEAECGISGSQVWILKEVKNNPGIGITTISEKLSIHQTTSSLLVEKLVKKKFLIKERSTEDQRKVGLNVTELGNSILELAPGPAEGLLPNAVRKLSSEKLVLLDALLSDVINELGNYDAQMANKPLADM
jgi:MarR family transcriptional regulator, organic hydroperoxide resistance regulator